MGLGFDSQHVYIVFIYKNINLSNLYFLNYKKFINAGFHIAKNISNNIIFSQKYFIARYKKISIIDIRQTFAALCHLIFFLQYYIKNFGFFFFFFNNNLLDAFFYNLTTKLAQTYYAGEFFHGMFSNDVFLFPRSLLNFTSNIIIFYFAHFCNLKFLQQCWNFNLPVFSFGVIFNHQLRYLPTITYILPVNTNSIKTLYFLSSFTVQYIKYHIYQNKFYFSKIKYF
jgi:ribosomal protein S2